MNPRPRHFANALLVALLVLVGVRPVSAAAPPYVVSASFAPDTIALGSTTQLTFNLVTDETSSVQIPVTFDDTLPAGLTVADGSTTVCAIGSLTTTAPATIHFNATFPAGQGWSCSIPLAVTGAVAGAYTYAPAAFESSTGTVTPAPASLTVLAPPTIAKAFGAPAIALGDSTSLTFTIGNPNSSNSLSGIGFTDNLPGGLVVATPATVTNGCGGMVSAAAASGTVSLSGGAVAAGASCQVVVEVTGAAQGSWTNMTGPVSSIEGGTGGTASADIEVALAPTIGASFSPATMTQGNTSTLTFTLFNPETSSSTVTGLAFSAVLPSGLSAADDTTAVCNGGTLTIAAGTITFGGGSLDPGWICSMPIALSAASAGTFTVTTSTLTSSGAVAGSPASATLTVLGPGAVGIFFNPSSVFVGGSTSLTFIIAAKTSPQTGVSFSTTLPAGLAATAGSASVCGGTVTATSTTIALSGATISVGSLCQFSVTVKASSTGTKTVSVVVSSDGGASPAATADLVVSAGATPPPTASTPGSTDEAPGSPLGLVVFLAALSALAVLYARSRMWRKAGGR